MRLDGIHHITCITADGPANADFYLQVMGLRLVKKTINFDVPDAYHLYYGSEQGRPGSLVTFFEFPNAKPGHTGAGQIHRLIWRVPSEGAIEFWAARLEGAGCKPQAGADNLTFADPEGLEFQLVIDHSGNEPPTADAADIPASHRIAGFEGVRTYAHDPGTSEELLSKTLGFTPEGGNEYSIQGDTRTSSYAYDPAPDRVAIEGAGSVHHIAWACEPDEQVAWQKKVRDSGMQVTEILDRTYFRSIYFREPSGVLFEIATKGPGFAVDEPLTSLGESLMLPEMHEALRARLEKILRPIDNPRTT